MHVSEETPVSLRVSWTPPNAHVHKYRVSYSELSPSERFHDRTVSQRPAGPAWNPGGVRRAAGAPRCWSRAEKGG